MTPRRKRRRCWWYTAGQAPYTVAVHERVPGGVLYERVYDPTSRARRRRSLGHRDQERAIAHAEAEARKLRAGVEALGGRPTVAGVLQLYLLHRSPEKESPQSRKDDARRAELWTRLVGAQLVSTLGDTEWNDFKRRRGNGAIDARGRVVPDERDDRGEPKRRPVGARAVDADLVFLIAAFNWAMGYKVKGRPLLERNPFGAPAPGVKRTLERPRNRAPLKPIATYDRFLQVRAAAERVWMECRKGELGAELLDRRPEGGAAAVMKWMKPSYLPELLDLVEATGRRISAICRLWYSDFVRHGGVVSAIRWRPFKREDEQIIPLSDRGQAAVARILAARPGLGDVPVFPANRGKGKAIGKRTATDWLVEAEKLAGVAHLEGGSFHPYRRKWATERKHLPTVDVMLAGGWKDDRSLKGSYQLADDATVLAVVNEPRKLVEKKNA